MSHDTERRVLARALLACVVSTLAGCTGLVSEKPLFATADYDTSASLLGHYKKVDDNSRVLVMRGHEGQLTILGFEAKKASSANKHASGTDNHEVLVQELYAEAAAVPLGGGDFALQISCSALMHDGKDYAPSLGGKKSPYRNYTVYGTIAQDRKKDYLWVSTNFYGGGDATDLIFNRYDVQKAPKAAGKDYDVRIIPPGTSNQTAMALLRDLIAQAMSSDGGEELYQRTNRDPQPDDDESPAITLNSSEQCRRVQAEGEPPPK